MRSSSAAGTSRKAPPEAVSTNRFTDEGISPTRHWKMAECSESTGITGARHRFASAMTSSPATTRVSLLASAIFLPAYRGGDHRHGGGILSGIYFDRQVGQSLRKRPVTRLVGDHHAIGAELFGLPREQFPVPARRQHLDFEQVGPGPRHVERLGADRAGRTQNGNPLPFISRCIRHFRRPFFRIRYSFPDPPPYRCTTTRTSDAESYCPSAAPLRPPVRRPGYVLRSIS